MDRVKKFLFLLLSSVIVVIFSEKTFWYIQGYHLLELFAVYMIPTVCFLWVLDRYSVKSLPALFLAAAVFGFVTEGILTPVLYENGFFDLLSISYTSLGWHAVISITFGWYFIHKWLLERDTNKIITFSLLYGLFWGLWSLVFWMPENITSSDFQAAEFTPGPWPIADFILFAFAMTAVLIAAHYLIGYIWQKEFKPTKLGVVITAITGVIFFTYQVLLSYPWAPLKFAAVMLPTLLFLKKSVPVQSGKSYLQAFAEKVRLQECLLLLFMPLAASFVYSIAYHIDLSVDIIAIISAIPSIYGLTLLGWVCWIGAMAVIIKTQNT